MTRLLNWRGSEARLPSARRRFRRTVRIFTALTVGGLVTGLGACSSAEPAPAPSTPSSAAPTPEQPSETATTVPHPQRPEAMERDDVEGAIAAAEYFIELYPYVYATGDLEEWEEISDADCQFCQGVADSASELRDSGGYGEGPVIEVSGREVFPRADEQNQLIVELSAEEGASRHLDSRGEAIKESDGGPLEILVAVSYDEAEWLVRGVRLREVDLEE